MSALRPATTCHPNQQQQQHHHQQQQRKKKKKLHSRQAVGRFLAQYNTSEERLHHFEHKLDGFGCAATLVLSGFHGRRFEGSSKGVSKGFSKAVSVSILDKRAAEQAACEAFKRDAQVKEVRRRLPPTMQQIRNFFTLSGERRQQLRAQAFEPGTVQTDIMKSI